jgi:hypothetical protein
MMDMRSPSVMIIYVEFVKKTNISTMKRNVLFMAGLVALVTLFSCSKEEDPGNAFTFNGEDYLINDVYLVEEIFNSETPSELHVFQFVFGNISGSDTTVLALAVLDPDVDIVGGNYPSLGYTEDAMRSLYPFALFFLSGLSLDGDTFYLTGEGGSVDVTVLSNGLYRVKVNKVSVGEYSILADNAFYEELGTVSGFYEGAIHKEVEEVGGMKSAPANARLNSLLQQMK